MSRINAVTVSEDKKSVIVGGGARWEHVFPVTDAANVAVVGGGVGNVGVRLPLRLAWLSLRSRTDWWLPERRRLQLVRRPVDRLVAHSCSRRLTGLYGLGCDNVLAAQVVLASGEVVRCDAKQEAELFWSIRGGSSNFGAITEFTIAAYPHPGPALSGVLVYIEPQLQTVYEAAKHFIDTRHPSQSFVLMFARSPHDASPSIVVPPYVPGPTKEEVAADPAFGGFFKAKVRSLFILIRLADSVQPVADHTYIAPGFDGISHGADAILLGGPRRKRASCVLFEIAMFHNQEMLNSTWELYKKASADLPGAQLMFEVCFVSLMLLKWLSTEQMHHPDKTASFAHDSVAYHAAGRRRHAYTLLVCQYDGAENDERAAAYIKAMAEHLRKEQIRVCGNDLNYNGNGVEEHEPIEMIYGNHLPRLRCVHGSL